jgi:hypothetical protein
MSQLKVKVSSKMKEGREQFSGTVEIPGLQKTKIARKKDGCTEFTTPSALKSTAQSLAKSLGFEGVQCESSQQKKAAKAKTKTKAKATKSKQPQCQPQQ